MSSSKNVGIHIGAEAFTGEPEEIAAAIAKIMIAGFNNHADQETIRFALKVFGNAGQPENVSVTNCRISDL